mgnify:CR=1 FL=1
MYSVYYWSPYLYFTSKYLVIPFPFSLWFDTLVYIFVSYGYYCKETMFFTIIRFSSESYPSSPMIILNLPTNSLSILFSISFESWISPTLYATIICSLSSTTIVVLTYFFFTLYSKSLSLLS